MLQHMLLVDVMCMLVSAAATIEVERLAQENAVLRQEVERLKQELVAAEMQNEGTQSVQCMYHHHLQAAA